MEIIEKNTETVKDGTQSGTAYFSELDNRFASKGVGGAGLGLGIAGTALGLLALGSRGSSGLLSGLNLFGGSSSGMPQNININSDPMRSLFGNGTANGVNGPTAFTTYQKECIDAADLSKAIYEYRIQDVQEANAARELDRTEKFDMYKELLQEDFKLYQDQRDEHDLFVDKINSAYFELYKSQRDSIDAVNKRIGELETKQAVSDAVEPWRAQVLNMQINGVAANAQAGLALEAERRACADGKIVNYCNSMFYPIEVADITIGSTSTTKSLYNPLATGSCPCSGTSLTMA